MNISPQPQRGPFQLSLSIFEGSVEMLARLAADRKIATDEIALADVASQYAQYLEERDEVDLEDAGDFLASAARLMLLKSTRALAVPVEDDEILLDQEDGLDIGRRDTLLRAATELRLREGLESVAPLAPPVIIEQRAEPRSPTALLRAWNQMRQREFVDTASVIMPAFVHLETAMSGLIRRLKASVRFSLHSVLRGGTTEHAVIHFIAVLELVRRRQASVDQTDLFGDITVQYSEHAADSNVRAG